MTQTSLTLYTFSNDDGMFNASPYCGKADILLKMAELPFSTENPEDYKVFSKGKLPVLKDGDDIIQDSEIIRLHLASKYGKALDGVLSAKQKAVGHAVCRMLDERTISGIVWSRWAEDSGWAQTRTIFFEGAPDEVAGTIRRQVTAGIIGGGFGRHSQAEMQAFIREDLKTLSVLLAKTDYYFGHTPTYIDATVFSFIANLFAAPIKTWTADLVAEFPNLIAYFERGMARWYPEGAKVMALQAAE